MTVMPQPKDPAKGFNARYDAWNRLVRLDDTASGANVRTFRHDGLHRMTGTSGVRHRYSADWQVLEDRYTNTAHPLRLYYWGARYVDELLGRHRDADNDGVLNDHIFATYDPSFSVTGVAYGGAGGITERFRYAYNPYGQRMEMNANYVPQADNLQWMVGHQGLMHDEWKQGSTDQPTGLVFNRHRVLHPLMGRFTNRDPIEYDAGSMNLYEYVGGEPGQLPRSARAGRLNNREVDEERASRRRESGEDCGPEAGQ